MGAPAGFTKKDALVRTKRTWLFVASLLICVIGFEPLMVAVLSAFTGHLHWMWGLLAVSGFFAGFVGTMHAWNRWWRERRGEVRADETGLWRGERARGPPIRDPPWSRPSSR